MRAVVVKMNTGYLATVYKGARCEGQIAIIPVDGRLEINEVAGSRPLLVVHNPERLTLLLGKYGLFHRDIPGPPTLKREKNDGTN